MGEVVFNTNIDKIVVLTKSNLATNVNLDGSLASAEPRAETTVELRNNRLNDGFGIDGAAVAAEGGRDRIADHFDFFVNRSLGLLNDRLDATSAGPLAGTDPADVGGVFSIKISDMVFSAALGDLRDGGFAFGLARDADDALDYESGRGSSGSGVTPQLNGLADNDFLYGGGW
jgi:hypothetical protein